MFEKRLRVFLTVLGVLLLVAVLRLGQLQIVRAEYYRNQARRSLTRKPTPLPFVRGRILDRTGEVLAQDEPCWDLTIDYGVLAADVGEDPLAFKRLVKRVKRSGRYPNAITDEEVASALRHELATMWRDIAAFTSAAPPVSVDGLRRRAKGIYDRVGRIRRAVARRRGFDAPVAEEFAPHPIVTGLDRHQQILARERLSRYGWVHVRSSTVRGYSPGATPLAHVLGRTARVDAAQVADDPNADDPFARYRADERVGVSGVEFTAERILRGRRGQILKNRQGDVVDEGFVEAQDGRDVALTIHAELQRRLFSLLGDAVETCPDSSGGAIVVLEVPSREVLALVSYPSYDPSRFDERYAALRDDTDHLPLRFRAVANQYAPGSTIKPLICLTGLMNGLITPESREECTGYLIPGVRDRWRCWRIHGTSRRKAHGLVNVVDALTGSCNIFLYRLGERIGVSGLCSAFDMVGIGRCSGTGLREEATGINPTPSWLMQYKNVRATPGTARLFAIGQGELAMTPVQVANLMATYASGRYAPVTLIRSPSPKPQWTLPATPEQWAAIRRGIYRVVNDPAGTAYPYVRFRDDRYALCGKTGTATAHSWPTAYRIPYTDGNGGDAVEYVPAGAIKPALDHFVARHPHARFDRGRIEVATRWPPNPPPAGEQYAHAWFGGFLQPLDASGRPDWSREAPVAFTVLVEFGGSGGRTSGPLARQVAAEILNVLEPDRSP